MTYHDPEPYDPDDSLGARRERWFAETAERQAAERVARADREFIRRYRPAEGRLTGEDGGRHHRQPATSRDGCGCGCQDAGGAARGTPVDAELDLLARQREDPAEAYERGQAEARAMADAMRGPMSPSEALVRLAELRVTEFAPEWGP
jgi:hypothetical protein